MFNNNGYVSPDYPQPNGGFNSTWTYQDQTNTQGFFYGGMGCNNYPAVNDPNSRLNQTSFNYGNQSPYQAQFYQQPVQNPAPVQPQVQVQPYSAYGGSGNQTTQAVMPTLGMPTFNQPAQSVAQPVQQPMPTFAQPTPMFYQNPNAPLFNAQIPTFDKRMELWGNQYVQPQQLPMPNIDWNKPVNQPMVNPMQNFQCFPSFNNPAQPFQDNWTEMYKRNLAVSL